MYARARAEEIIWDAARGGDTVCCCSFVSALLGDKARRMGYLGRRNKRVLMNKGFCIVVAFVFKFTFAGSSCLR